LISPKTKNKKTPWVQRRESFLLVLKIYGGALRNLKSFTHCQSAAATPHGDLRRQQPIKIHHVHPLQQSVPSTPSFTQADVLWLFKSKPPSTSSPQQAPHFVSPDSLMQVFFVCFVILSWGYIRSFGLSF